jgi:type II secretory pathway pseudopilin PulG
VRPISIAAPPGNTRQLEPEPTISQRNAHPQERAFTIIELIVSFVLLGIALALASTALLQGVDGSDRAAEAQRLRTQFDQARTMLAADLHSARAPGRDFAQLRDLMAFQQEIAKGQNALPDSWDLHDVKQATGTQLTFVGDAVSDPVGGAMAGPECVSWRLRTDTTGPAPSWVLERGIAPYSSTCPAGGNWEWATWIGPVLVGGDAAGLPTAAFRRYQLTCNPLVCTGAATGTGKGLGNAKGKGAKKEVTILGAGACGEPALSDTVSGSRELGWITSVDLDLGGIATRRNSAQREELRTSIALRNRLSDDYLFALGCAQ